VEITAGRVATAVQELVSALAPAGARTTTRDVKSDGMNFFIDDAPPGLRRT
jgi:hypothetical protein